MILGVNLYQKLLGFYVCQVCEIPTSGFYSTSLALKVGHIYT